MIVDAGYDVWAPRRRRRRERVDYDRLAGVVLEPPGTSNWRRVGDGERIRCGRKHRGADGVVTIDSATIGPALRRAGVLADLPRVVLEPALLAVYPEQTAEYAAELAELAERDRDYAELDRELLNDDV